jgi:hypothetical protein
MPLNYPTKNNLYNHAPKGPPDFQYGWENGCNTISTPFESFFYADVGTTKFNKDFKYAETHPDYEVGWQMGFWYCIRASERYSGFNGSAPMGIW